MASPQEPDAIRTSLYPWQAEALDAWTDAGYRGIVSAATGTGKTRLALAAVELLRERSGGNLKTILVVPTVALRDQWMDEVSARLRLYGSSLQCTGRDHDPSTTADFVVAVINSARTVGPRLAARWHAMGHPVLLLVDECHRAGSRVNSRVFDATYDYTLGLSATPEREADRGTEEKLLPSLGQIIYRYSRNRAESEGVISPVDLVEVIIELTVYEGDRYQELSDELRRITGELLQTYPWLTQSRNLLRDINALRSPSAPEDGGQDPATAWLEKARQRKRLLDQAGARAPALAAVLDLFEPDEQILIFHQEIAAAEHTASVARERGIAVATYHSGVDPPDRAAVLGRFRRGSLRWLSCVRAIDEGLDVPAVSGAIIHSASYSVRQTIQRLGRVSRLGGRERSLVVRIRAVQESRAPVYDKDGEPLVSRYAAVSWPGQAHLLSDEQAIEPLFAPPEKWFPDQSNLEGGEGLTLRQLIHEITHRSVETYTIEDLVARGDASPSVLEFFNTPPRTSSDARQSDSQKSAYGSHEESAVRPKPSVSVFPYGTCSRCDLVNAAARVEVPRWEPGQSCGECGALIDGRCPTCGRFVTRQGCATTFEPGPVDPLAPVARDRAPAREGHFTVEEIRDILEAGSPEEGVLIKGGIRRETVTRSLGNARISWDRATGGIVELRRR